MSNLIMGLVAIPLKLEEFVKDHPLYSLIIFILILSIFVPIPYLHDFMQVIINSIKGIGIGIGSTGR